MIPQFSPEFSPATRNAILRAQNLAASNRSGFVSETHLFLGILEDEEDEAISALLAVSGISRDEARLYAQSALEDEPTDSVNEPRLSVDAKKMLELAGREFYRADTQFIEPHHLFIACVSHRRGPHLGEVLRPLGLNAARLRQHLQGMKASRNPRNPREKLTARAEKAIEVAHAEMRASYCGRISTAHLLLGILGDESNMAVSSLKQAGCDLEALKNKARASIQNDGEIAMTQKRFSPGAKRALERAAREAKRSGCKFIDCGHLLLGLLPQRETRGEKWKARGQTLDSLDFLWNSAQVEVLQLALRDASGVPKANAMKSAAPILALQINWGMGIFSFVLALLWLGAFDFLLAKNQLHDSFASIGVAVPVLTGIAVCASIVLKRSSQTRDAWLSIFGGWIMGVMMGVYLSQIL